MERVWGKGERVRSGIEDIRNSQASPLRGHGGLGLVICSHQALFPSQGRREVTKTPMLQAHVRNNIIANRVTSYCQPLNLFWDFFILYLKLKITGI